jgi:hypothetical protein
LQFLQFFDIEIEIKTMSFFSRHKKVFAHLWSLLTQDGIGGFGKCAFE